MLLVIWEIYGRRVNKALFAPPTAVLAAGIDMTSSGELWNYLRGSLQVLAIGFLISLALGIPLGVAIARSHIVRYALDWYVDAFNSTPNAALVPLMTLIFGFDVTAKVIVVVFSSVFAVIVNTFLLMVRVLPAAACAVLSLLVKFGPLVAGKIILDLNNLKIARPYSRNVVNRMVGSLIKIGKDLRPSLIVEKRYARICLPQLVDLCPIFGLACQMIFNVIIPVESRNR